MKLAKIVAMVSVFLLSCSSETKTASESSAEKGPVVQEEMKPKSEGSVEEGQAPQEGTKAEQPLPGGTRWVISVKPEGVKAFAIDEGSFAANTGIEMGDVVQSIDGTAVRTLEELAAAVASKPTTSVEIKVIRDSKEVVLKTTP